MNYTIVIDYQKDFIDGALANTEAQNIRPNVIKHIKEAISKQHSIIFTKDTHDAYFYPYTNEGKHLPVPHCIRNTEGWEIDSETWTETIQAMLKAQHNCGVLPPMDVIEKPTFGYKGWNLFNPENIYVFGVCTDICVVSNVLILKALYPTANVIVYSDACAGLTVEKHQHALDVMASCQVEVK
jgi:nicotinamidase-related amidase